MPHHIFNTELSKLWEYFDHHPFAVDDILYRKMLKELFALPPFPSPNLKKALSSSPKYLETLPGDKLKQSTKHVCDSKVKIELSETSEKKLLRLAFFLSKRQNEYNNEKETNSYISSLARNLFTNDSDANKAEEGCEKQFSDEITQDSRNAMILYVAAYSKMVKLDPHKINPAGRNDEKLLLLIKELNKFGRNKRRLKRNDCELECTKKLKPDIKDSMQKHVEKLNNEEANLEFFNKLNNQNVDKKSVPISTTKKYRFNYELYDEYRLRESKILEKKLSNKDFAEIIDKIKLDNNSKTPIVFQVLFYIKRRQFFEIQKLVEEYKIYDDEEMNEECTENDKEEIKLKNDSLSTHEIIDDKIHENLNFIENDKDKIELKNDSFSHCQIVDKEKCTENDKDEIELKNDFLSTHCKVIHDKMNEKYIQMKKNTMKIDNGSSSSVIPYQINDERTMNEKYNQNEKCSQKVRTVTEMAQAVNNCTTIIKRQLKQYVPYINKNKSKKTLNINSNMYKINKLHFNKIQQLKKTNDELKEKNKVLSEGLSCILDDLNVEVVKRKPSVLKFLDSSKMNKLTKIKTYSSEIKNLDKFMNFE